MIDFSCTAATAAGIIFFGTVDYNTWRTPIELIRPGAVKASVICIVNDVVNSLLGFKGSYGGLCCFVMCVCMLYDIVLLK